jgi:hypothetical protein
MNVNRLLHTLWTKAVGTVGYDKKEWQALAAYLNGVKTVDWAEIPHSCIGRWDRDCEKCGRSDRAEIHKGNV